MPPFRLLALALGAGLAAGCTVGPDYHRPDAPLVQRYLGQDAVDRRTASTPAALDTWWKGFGDRRLDALVDQALAQNLDLVQARARLAQARAAVGAANAALLPSANVDGQAARAYQSVETPLGQVLDRTPGYDRYGNAYALNLEAGWEMDLFGGLRRDREAAVAEYQASAAGVAATRLAIVAQTADLYTVVRGLQARLRIAHQQAETRASLLEKVRLLHAQGLAAEYQVHQSEGELAEARARIPALLNGLDTALNALDVLLASPPGTHRSDLADGAAIPAPPALAATGSPAELLRRRPDIIVAERRLQAANARIGAALSEYYPKLSLGALLGSATSVSAGHLFSNGASQASATLGLRWRLFDFARINAQIDQARGAEAEALASYRQTVLRASEDVENAFSALVNREAQALTLSDGEHALSRARQATFQAWQSGTASLIEVLNADQTLLRTADARAQAQTEAAQAAIASFRALGGGWDAPASMDDQLASTTRP